MHNWVFLKITNTNEEHCGIFARDALVIQARAHTLQPVYYTAADAN